MQKTGFLTTQLNCVCFAVAIVDLVHDVKATHGLSLLLTESENLSEI